MAEILAIVSGGVSIASFAVQISEKVIQIKRFLDTVKSAPLEVKELLEEIEILNETLLDLEEQNHQTVDDRVIKCCESHCRQAAQLIAELLNGLLDKIGKRRSRGSISFAFKRGDIDQIFGRLERIKSTLGLAILRMHMYDAKCCVYLRPKSCGRGLLGAKR
jgi:hypothetical protein